MSRRIGLVATRLVAMLTLLLVVDAARAAEPPLEPGAGPVAGNQFQAGQVLALAGACFDEAPGGQRVSLRAGDPVRVGDTVEASAGGKLKLRLIDGSVISVASGTRFTIAMADSDGAGQHRDIRMSLASGLLRSVVAPMSQASTFEITTATAVAAARSTDWYVEARPASSRVAVLSGSVSVTGRGTAVMVAPRSGTDVDAGRAPQPPRAFTQAEFDELAQRTNLSAGWCQCIDDRTRINGVCSTSIDACQAFCAGGHYSFIPSAPGMCGSGS